MAARWERALAKGKGFEKLSDDDGSGSNNSDLEEDEIRIAGAVNPSDTEYRPAADVPCTTWILVRN